MISAREGPGSGGQKLGGGREEISVPGVPGVAGGSASAHGLLVGGARHFSVKIIAYVDHQVRAALRRAPGCDLCEGPLLGIVTGLQFVAFDAASGVAERDHAGGIRARQRERLAVDRCGLGAVRDRELARWTQAFRQGLAQRHGTRRAVDLNGGAIARVGDDDAGDCLAAVTHGDPGRRKRLAARKRGGQ